MRQNLAHLLSLAHERADRWLVAELVAAGLKGLAPSHGDVFALIFQKGEATMHEIAAFATPVSPEPLHGAEGYLSVVSLMRASFPGVQWKLEDMVADEKTVAVRGTCTGTFTGKAPFAGIKPNGRKFSTSVMNFYVFDDEGKIIDDIAATGMLGILQGIGTDEQKAK